MYQHPASLTGHSACSVSGEQRSLQLSVAVKMGVVGRHTPASLLPQSPHFGLVPFFLVLRSLCSPPGVLMVRTLLLTVLYGCLLLCIHVLALVHTQIPLLCISIAIRRSTSVGGCVCVGVEV